MYGYLSVEDWYMAYRMSKTNTASLTDEAKIDMLADYNRVRQRMERRNQIREHDEELNALWEIELGELDKIQPGETELFRVSTS